ncbi:prepilin-type N-terminal cleavage/methylation domain-containing protein [Pedobacter westerhofensis]|nr:prepilin-type N-terminal cleavage/methylation domain-containing protein [Pedobacter westerhofensis]
MNAKKKIPAFTLMEVTIAMLIAAIAIVITYTAYHIISGTYHSYAKKQDRIAAFSLADRLLKKDFLNADQIIRTAEGMEFQSGNGLVIYQFRDSLMLRSQHALRTDTFKFPLQAPRLTFENAEAAEAIDQLEYQTTLEGQNITLTYKKSYSSQSLFK